MSKSKLNSLLKAGSTVTFLLSIAKTSSARELPREEKAPPETYADVDVLYRSVADPDGERLRTIITNPHDVQDKLQVIFVVGPAAIQSKCLTIKPILLSCRCPVSPRFGSWPIDSSADRQIDLNGT